VCKVFRRHTKNNTGAQTALYSVHGKTVQVMSTDDQLQYKTKGPLLSMVPFRGRYISLKELHTHIPKKFEGWEGTVKSLGRPFLEGIFDSTRAEYPKSQFQPSQRCSRNRWLSDKFAATEKRLVS
jgi:hypothetical protein